MPYDPRDPDTGLVAIFKHMGVPNLTRTAQEGRKIFDDIEVCEIRIPGKTQMMVFPAHDYSASGWVPDGEGGQMQITYAERFKKQYQQFKDHEVQTKSGTPLDEVPWLTQARVLELKAVNVYTIETLAEMDGLPLKNLGVGARDLKNKAIEWIAERRAAAPAAQVLAELEALRARAQILEEDNRLLKHRTDMENAKVDAQFDDMTDVQLKDYITSNTGHEPKGQLNRKSLLRMAADARPRVMA